MVLPIKNISSINPATPAETPITPDMSGTEGGPLTPESVSSISNSPAASNQPTTDSQPTDPNASAPQPGKIVDKSKNHKEHITSISTPDPITIRADQEENEFIPRVEEVHDAAYHAKHS